MRILRTLLLVPLLVPLISCQPDPGPKKVPFEKKSFVSKATDFEFVANVDILFIIDDSGSMNTHQQNLSNNVGVFSKELLKLPYIDWHFGVITSSTDDASSIMDNGRLVHLPGKPKYIDRNTPGKERLISQYMIVGTSGDFKEEFFSVGMEAFSPALANGHNKGFHRPDSILLIFIVTDTDDQSIFSVNDTVDFFRALKKGKKDRIVVASAVATTNSCWREQEPSQITEFTRIMNGRVFDLCHSDFGQEMADIASQVRKLTSVVPLTQIPVVSTIKISYGSQIVPRGIKKGWTYNPDRNVIYFGEDLELKEEPPGTKLKIEFEEVYKPTVN